MIITQLTIEQINTALLSLEQAGGNSNVDMTAINKLKADLETLKKKIGEGGIKPGQTYDINITGSATSATSANTASQDGDGNTISTTYQKVNEKGEPNGYASLGVNGTVPIEQLPTELIVLKGFWNAETNTPHLQDGVGTSGDYYIVENGGTVDLGNGPITFYIGDGVIYANDNKWHRKADANLVQSVAGKVGVVELEVNDLTDNDILARKAELKPVATSGNYDDLTNKPALKTVATSGSYNDLTNKPELKPVATSGNYNDLTNKPEIKQEVVELTEAEYNALTTKDPEVLYALKDANPITMNLSGLLKWKVLYNGGPGVVPIPSNVNELFIDVFHSSYSSRYGFSLYTSYPFPLPAYKYFYVGNETGGMEVIFKNSGNTVEIANFKLNGTSYSTFELIIKYR